MPIVSQNLIYHRLIRINYVDVESLQKYKSLLLQVLDMVDDSRQALEQINKYFRLHLPVTLNLDKSTVKNYIVSTISAMANNLALLDSILMQSQYLRKYLKGHSIPHVEMAIDVLDFSRHKINELLELKSHLCNDSINLRMIADVSTQYSLTLASIRSKYAGNDLPLDVIIILNLDPSAPAKPHTDFCNAIKIKLLEYYSLSSHPKTTNIFTTALYPACDNDILNIFNLLSHSQNIETIRLSVKNYLDHMATGFFGNNYLRDQLKSVVEPSNRPSSSLSVRSQY